VGTEDHGTFSLRIDDADLLIYSGQIAQHPALLLPSLPPQSDPR
jgi:hypothetical protein